jgi:hypothetical protein
MQFDLFEYNRDTGMRHDVLKALEQFDAPAARQALATLQDSFPQDATLPDMLSLIAALEQSTPGPFPTHSAAATLRLCLSQVEAIALYMFEPAQGQQWLDKLWGATALRAAALPFLAKESENHAAPLYLRAHDWPAAESAVSAIASWRRIPAPLAWMAEAKYHLEGLTAVWPLLCELAWIAPGRFVDLVQRLADPALSALLKKFYAEFEGHGDESDVSWFPAWLLIENGALVAHLYDLQPARDGAPEQAALTLRELLGLERRGQQQAIIERRRRLQGLQPHLYAAYMKTR